MYDAIPQAAMPVEQEDQARWREQGLRYRLLTGKHADDVRDEIEEMFAREIAADLEINPDLSRNSFRLIYQQLAVAYLEPPHVRVKDEAEADLTPIVTPKLWAQQQQTNLYSLAMGETLVRLDFKHWAGAEEVSYRMVLPNHVVCKAMPGQPDEPGMVEELRYRDGVWTWDVWDVRDPNNPVFRIDKVDDDERIDATQEYAPELAGEGAYPYRSREGKPILPYVLYHRQVGSQLWNWSSGMEVCRGALRLCALMSHWNDGFVNAAHPQRYAIDVDTQAGVTRTIGGTPVDVVPVDRKSILKFQSKGPGGGSLGQFTAAMNPLAAMEALRLYEQGLAVFSGLNPSDLVTGSAQSGYAIVVSREGQKRYQKLVEPALRLADQMLLAKAAQMANFYLPGSALSENPRDYIIEYVALAQSPQERQVLTESLAAEMNMGIASRIDVLRKLNPEIENEEQALERLLRIRTMERDLQRLAAEEGMAQPQKEEKPEDDFEPHYMYDPESGEREYAEKREDHERLQKQGYVHENPKGG